MTGLVDRVHAILEARNAVLMAAKAWHNPTLNNNDRYRAEDALHRAIDAMTKLENAR